MKKLSCYGSTFFTTIFASKRFVFAAETPKSGPEGTEGAKEKPEKNLEDLKAEAEAALKDADDEMGNIEKKYKIPKGATDKQLDAVAGKNKMPDKVKEAYSTLRNAVKDLRDYLKATEDKRREADLTLQLSLGSIDVVFMSLKAGEEPKNTPRTGDPLGDFEDTSDRYVPLHTVRTKIALPSEIKAEAERHTEQVAVNLMDKLYSGQDFNKEEAKMLVATFQGKDHLVGIGPDSTAFILDLSTDKKSVRIQTTETTGEHGLKEFNTVRTQALEPGNEGTKNFKTLTENEKEQKTVDANKTKLGQDLNWLKSEKAPVGSVIMLSSENITRKNWEKNINEQFQELVVVKKAADGRLYMATLESPIVNGKTDTSKTREINTKPLDQTKAMELVSSHFAPLQIEANDAMQSAEVKRSLDQTGGLLARSIIFGKDSPLYRQYSQKITDVIQKNQKLLTDGWSYNWKELNVTVSYNPADKMVAVSEGNRIPGQAPTVDRLAFNDTFSIEKKATA